MLTTWELAPRAQKHLDENPHFGRQDMLGSLEFMLSDVDRNGAVRQLNNAYAHGGGWNKFEGFGLGGLFGLSDAGDPWPELTYPGDPPRKAIARTQLRDEKVYLFDSSWVAVVQPDGSFEVARMG